MGERAVVPAAAALLVQPLRIGPGGHLVGRAPGADVDPDGVVAIDRLAVEAQMQAVRRPAIVVGRRIGAAPEHHPIDRGARQVDPLEVQLVHHTDLPIVDLGRVRVEAVGLRQADLDPVVGPRRVPGPGPKRDGQGPDHVREGRRRGLGLAHEPRAHVGGRARVRRRSLGVDGVGGRVHAPAEIGPFGAIAHRAPGASHQQPEPSQSKSHGSTYSKDRADGRTPRNRRLRDEGDLESAPTARPPFAF